MADRFQTFCHIFAGKKRDGGWLGGVLICGAGETPAPQLQLPQIRTPPAGSVEEPEAG
jgi:hypothetical protein